MAETYIQMFEEKYYPIIFAEAAERCICNYADQKEKIALEWKKEFTRYLDELVRKQKEEQEGAVGDIYLSFLYSSLDRKPVFQVDAYGTGDRIYSHSILTGYLNANWMVEELDFMGKRLEEKAKEQKLQRYIRTAEIQRLKLRAAKSFLWYFALRFKYMVPEFVDMRTLAKVEKLPVFRLQIGEYMDWQKTIYAIMPGIDLFNCDKNEDLRFRNFPAIYYDKKKFHKWNMSQSKFQDCTFKGSEVQDCIMNDCTFDGCIFDHVCISNTQMMGSLFIRCKFKNVQMMSDSFMQKEQLGDDPDYYEPAEFYECEFTECYMNECNLEQCFVTNCDVEHLELCDCSTIGSGFTKMKNIIWNNKEGE